MGFLLTIIQFLGSIAKMGIVLIIIRFLGNIADDEENRRPRANAVPSRNDSHNHHSESEYNLSPQWQRERNSMKETERANGRLQLHAVTVKSRVAPAPAREGRWIKHYISCHRILLVGEGDFSFSTCLAAAFGLASNMVATSLDSKAFLLQNYGRALSNLVELNIRKCRVMHEVDATKMASHELLGRVKFDRIVYNFPFAGFFPRLPRESQLKHHRRLVSLFLKNAKEMIREKGEVHITHKTNSFHAEWNLEAIASCHGLYLVEAVQFNLGDYPGYNTKRGFGGDDNFDCYPSKTYKFGLKSW